MYFTIFCWAINAFVIFDQKMVSQEDHSAEVVKLFEQYNTQNNQITYKYMS